MSPEVVIGIAVTVPALICSGAVGLLWKNFSKRMTTIEGNIHDPNGRSLLVSREEWMEQNKKIDTTICNKIDTVLTGQEKMEKMFVTKLDKMEGLFLSKMTHMDEERDKTRDRTIDKYSEILLFMGSTRSSLKETDKRIKKLEEIQK